jgi:hypothetical protein
MDSDDGCTRCPIVVAPPRHRDDERLRNPYRDA